MRAFATAVFLLISLSFSSVSCCSSDNYVVSQDYLNWFQALINCRKNGMELASITSSAEELEIEKALELCKAQEGFKKGYWISLAQPGLDPKNEWSWFSNGEKLTYTNWAPGKPGNPAAKCTEITKKNHKYVWNNLMCEKNHTNLRYVCQRKKSKCE